MAHDRNSSGPRRASGTLAALILSSGAAAATLGDIEVRSRLGDVLDAAIAVSAAPGERLDPDCISVSRGAATEGPFVARARVAVVESPAGTVVRIQSEAPIADATTRLRVVVRCPGQVTLAYREYRGLFDPQPQAPGPIALPQRSGMPAAPASAPLTTSFPVMAGDTIESLSAKIHSRDLASQRSFAQALREANPSFGSLSERDPLPEGTLIALPDLRTLPPARPASAPAPVPRAVSAPPAKRDALPVPPPPLPRESARPREPREREKAAPPLVVAPSGTASAPRTRGGSGSGTFSLRLSAPEVDLTRSRGIDDATRARIRERQLVLDADDHVAAFLSLRDSVRRLETRVAELQLKLSGMPSSFPAAPAREPEPAKAAAAPAKTEPAPQAPALAKVDAPKVEPPKAEPPKVEPPKPEPGQANRPEPKVGVAPRPATAPAEDGLPVWLWAVVAALALLAIGLALSILRRRKQAAPGPRHEWPDPTEPRRADSPPPRFDHLEIAEGDAKPAQPDAMQGRRVLESDAGLATELSGGDAAELRRRYIEGRFPEIANRTILLEDPDSVVKAGRLFYEDGAVSRAVELLQFATEENPGVVKPWLALFEIYRLERRVAEFSDLARKFKELHGDTENWRKVQFFGREIEPANPLYRDLSVGIETIKFEVGKPPPAASFDPIAENWLNAPMDFENEVLANDLRRALMQDAGLKDEDLVPNPMPALRSVEMFSVA